MKRSGPIRRKKPMRRASPRRVTRPGPGSDPAYRSWVHGEPCVIAGAAHDCAGRIEQSHERNMTGLGLKEADRRSVAMCTRAHAEWERHAGYFFGWSKERRRLWMGARIAEHNARFDTGEV